MDPSTMLTMFERIIKLEAAQHALEMKMYDKPDTKMITDALERSGNNREDVRERFRVLEEKLGIVHEEKPHFSTTFIGASRCYAKGN